MTIAPQKTEQVFLHKPRRSLLREGRSQRQQCARRRLRGPTPYTRRTPRRSLFQTPRPTPAATTATAATTPIPVETPQELMTRAWPILQKYARMDRWRVWSQDPRDFAAEVALYAMERADRYDPAKAKLSTWLWWQAMAVFKKEVGAAERKAQREVEYDPGVAYMRVDCATPPPPDQVMEARACLVMLWEDASDDERDAMVATALGLDPTEIQETYGVTSRTLWGSRAGLRERMTAEAA